jgi:sporulation protein YlmC with PRC-barrel domain
MVKQLLLTSAMAMALAVPAFAQTANAPSSAKTTMSSSEVRSDKLVGHAVVNAQNERVGNIDSVILGAQGHVDKVVIGVGGFLGMGERDIAVNWRDLQVLDNGSKIVVNASRDQLKAMPEFKYDEQHRRGSTFSMNDAGRATATSPAADTRTVADDRARRANTGDPTNAGGIDAHQLIGRSIVNQDNATVGKIASVIMDNSGTVDRVIVGVGGFLGIGQKDVAVSWLNLKVMNNGEKVVMNTTRDQLKAMPAFTYPENHRPGDVYRSEAVAGRSAPTIDVPGTGTSTPPRNR